MKPPDFLSFRPATPADVPAIRALADRIWRACYRDILPSGQLEYMLDRIDRPDVRDIGGGFVMDDFIYVRSLGD